LIWEAFDLAGAAAPDSDQQLNFVNHAVPENAS
jgi:hypothetical protein